MHNKFLPKFPVCCLFYKVYKVVAGKLQNYFYNYSSIRLFNLFRDSEESISIILQCYSFFFLLLKLTHILSNVVWMGKLLIFCLLKRLSRGFILRYVFLCKDSGEPCHHLRSKLAVVIPSLCHRMIHSSIFKKQHV